MGQVVHRGVRVTAKQFISWRRLRGAARPLVLELLICVALPSVLMVSMETIAQKTLSAQSQQRSDDRIAEDINNKLMASPRLRPLDLGVWVHEGTATLTGTVPGSDLRIQADTLVQDVPGVKTVDDRLTVGVASATAPGFPDRQTTTAPRSTLSSRQPPPQENYPASSAGESPQRSAPQAGSPPPIYRRSSPQRMLAIPVGTPIFVMMLQAVDSRHTQPGTGFRGVLARDIVLQNGTIAIPRGAYVDGSVIDARPPGNLKGRPKLALQLSNVDVGNTSYVLTSNVWARRGPGKGGQTAQTVTGTAAFGAIAGGVVGGGPVALLGAAIGGLGGAGLSALSPGPQLLVPAESIVTFHLNAPLTVREPTQNEIRALAANAPAYGYGRRRRPYYPGYPPPPVSPPMPGAPPGGYPY